MSLKDNIRIDEKNHVEEPFLAQLEAMEVEGISPVALWQIIRLEKSQHPTDTGRSDFSEVVIQTDLVEALQHINPWLEKSQLIDLVNEITSLGGHDLIADNQKVLELILKGQPMLNEKTSISETARYIDLDNPENNTYVAVSQMKIRIPGTDNHIYPDIICFVNGLPLVVVECKSPKAPNPIDEAIEQLMRYSAQRGDREEGSKLLFAYNQIIIATCRNKAKFGTITTNSEKYFYRWTDSYPHTLDQLIDYTKTQKEYYVNEQGEDGEHVVLRTSPNDQQRLIHGMLLPANLLSILKSFTIFSTNDKGEAIKIVGRYQQFRAVHKAVERIQKGKNKKDRGGIVWHTQGSGKSLTMVFLVRHLWSVPELMDYKFILVTDRTQLDQQLSETAQNIGYTVAHPTSVQAVKDTLKSGSYNIASIMIQKFQEKDFEGFPRLDASDRIIVMTDEAHRSQYKLLRANLDNAIPNSTHIGFTGTPIDKTETTFGDYIDKYTMRQAIDDEVTLEIVYEGKANITKMSDRKAADAEFLDVFNELDAAELTKIMGYGTRKAYLETRSVIADKSKDMLKHYLTEVFPNGFKAQVVCNSKEAAHRYRLELEAAIENAIVNPELFNIEKPYSSIAAAPQAEYENAQEKPDLWQLLNDLKVAVIVSPEQNEDSHLRVYNDSRKQQETIASFKVPFGKLKEGIKGDVGILIVVDMLTTGFDAPIEQVMYIDKVMVMHNLLQAIARVNRVGGEGKDVGFVVDYVGIGHHLKEALDDYAEREQKEVLSCMSDINELRNAMVEARNELYAFFAEHNITDFSDFDAIYYFFYDDDNRQLFTEKYRAFTKALNNLYPRKEALEFIQDFQRFSEINVQAGLHTRDTQMSLKHVPSKLRAITDKYLESKGVYTEIEPIAITDDGFMKHVESRKSNKTKAAEIEHAIRHYINININEDPELFLSFSEMLDEILSEFAGRWEIIRAKLAELRERILARDKEPTYGLDRKTQMPYFRVLKNLIFSKEHELSDNEIDVLVAVTKEIYDKIQLETTAIGFWHNVQSQNVLRSELVAVLISKEHNLYQTIPGLFPKRNEIVTRLFEIAKPK